MLTTHNPFISAWIARYEELDTVRKTVETRVANADNERSLNIWRRFLTSLNNKLDEHVALWKVYTELVGSCSKEVPVIRH